MGLAQEKVQLLGKYVRDERGTGHPSVIMTITAKVSYT